MTSGRNGMKAEDKRTRLLDVAEDLFSERGFQATSLRDITSAANTNVAAVNYYFKSKEGLIYEVFARRIGPVNDERIRRLDALESSAGDGPVPLKAVVEALIAPALRMNNERDFDGPRFVRLMGRLFLASGDALERVHAELFRDVQRKFLKALGRALPNLEPRELMWRVQCMIGAFVHTMSGTQRLKAVAESPWT